MKKIALFGGSGRTGLEFLSLALKQGYAVKALVRTPSKIPFQDPNLTLIQGDVLDAQAVGKTVEGCEIVVSLFGQVKGSPKDLQTQGTGHIVEAMRAKGVNKIISLSGGGLPYPAQDRPKLSDKIIRGLMKIFVPQLIDDAIGHHKVLERSGLTWLIVRAPRLTQGQAKKQYRVGWVGVNASTQIARADLADFILKQVESEVHHFTLPFVSY